VDRCSDGIWWAQPIGESLVDEMTSALSAEADPQLKSSISRARGQLIVGS